MDSPDSTSARLVRLCLLFGLVIYGFGFWVNRALAFTDFRVLHLAGRLVNNGRADVAYDPDAFLQEAATDRYLADTARELDVFISPPPFALAIRPFSLLPSQTALVLWLAIGVLAVVGAVRLLRLPWWSAAVALVMPFSIANFYHAQTGFLAVLWVAAIHRLSVDDRPAAAGAIAGLAVLKPTLLLGVAVWWLLDWRRWYPALASALGVGTTIVAATVFGGLEQWRLFLGALDARAALDQQVIANQPTLAEAVNRAFGTEVGSHPAAFITYVVLGAVVMFFALRRWRDDTAVLSGFAVLVSILISPHLLIYDAGIVVIPMAVLVSSGLRPTAVERLTAIYVLTSLLTIMSIGWLSQLNDWTVPGTVGMVIITGVWARHIDHAPGNPRSENGVGSLTSHGLLTNESGEQSLAA